jgi:hypothetical protein
MVLAFAASTGICWIQTDDGAYTDVTNCMMLAALPGMVGDGSKVSLSYTKTDGTTPAGDPPTPVKSQLLIPSSAFWLAVLPVKLPACAKPRMEKAMFVNIQHPGETTKMADIADPTKYTSHWPGNYGLWVPAGNNAPSALGDHRHYQKLMGGPRRYLKLSTRKRLGY